MSGLRAAALLAAALSAVLSCAAGCGSTAPAAPPPPARGFVLPPGDPGRGSIAFVELRCCDCHAVRGGGFPEPTLRPPLPFVLGDGWETPPSEEWLAASIADPTHEVLPGNVVSFHGSGEVYRMTDFSETMTIGQLRDLVAFLRTLARKGERL
ncbi:MAG: cytochrome c [Planctomycetes bacterium]|nr:cytochrome c [Planctomycetota bacterium]